LSSPRIMPYKQAILSLLTIFALLASLALCTAEVSPFNCLCLLITADATTHEGRVHMVKPPGLQTCMLAYASLGHLKPIEKKAHCWS
jgi:hypothetical protein